MASETVDPIDWPLPLNLHRVLPPEPTHCLCGHSMNVFQYNIVHCRSVAVLFKDQIPPNAPSLWCSTCVVCDIAGYTRGLHTGILMSLLAVELRTTTEH